MHFIESGIIEQNGAHTERTHHIFLIFLIICLMQLNR